MLMSERKKICFAALQLDGANALLFTPSRSETFSRGEVTQP